MRRSASRNARAFCRSREVLQTTGANICTNLIGDRTKAPVIREIAVDLAIPGGIVTLADKDGKLRQFISGESLYCSLDFGETHSRSVSKWVENAILRGKMVGEGRRIRIGSVHTLTLVMREQVLVSCRKISRNFFSSRCHVTLCRAGDADGRRFSRARDWAVEHAFASYEFEVRARQSDAASGLHFHDQRTRAVSCITIGVRSPLQFRLEKRNEQNDNNATVHLLVECSCLAVAIPLSPSGAP
jgi:hypothetical protein